jgi:hypothetical protein
MRTDGRKKKLLGEKKDIKLSVTLFIQFFFFESSVLEM